MSNTRELYVTRSNRVQAYPTDGSLKHLLIDSTVLLEDLLTPPIRPSLLIALSTAKSLTISRMNDCAWMFGRSYVLEAFFSALQSMEDIERLTMEDFTLPAPSSPPPAPRCIANAPIYVPKLGISDTNGASLTFLLDCITTDHLSLHSCSQITDLPDSDALVLCGIPHSPGLFDALVGWDGIDLVICSCPFFDEEFNVGLKQVMMDTQEPIWPYASGNFTGCPYTVRRQIYEWQDLRMRL